MTRRMGISFFLLLLLLTGCPVRKARAVPAQDDAEVAQNDDDDEVAQQDDDDEAPQATDEGAAENPAEPLVPPLADFPTPTVTPDGFDPDDLSGEPSEVVPNPLEPSGHCERQSG